MKGRGSHVFLSFVILSAAMLWGCDQIPFLKKQAGAEKKTTEAKAAKPQGTIAAKVNDSFVTLEDLNQEVAGYNNLVPADRPELKIDTRDKKLDYLRNELVRRELLYQEGMARNLDDNPEVEVALNKLKQNLVVAELVREETANIDVTSQEIEEYYNRFKEQLREPEQRRFRIIVTAGEDEAKQALIQLLQGVDFATVARNSSKDSSAANGGDIGFVAAGQKFKEFEDVAFSPTLEQGKTSSIFKGPDGYYIIKLEEKKGGQTRSLAQMWDDIKNGLRFLKQQQKIEELIGGLSSKSKIEVYEDKVE
ncbi:MAG: peptidyl-prolyl cis-trans isomerase [Candidatus Omnitrophica bacterium]|nr:peptidyl-prolyl cis-trans isomerase [Candidatus Omnitrophota bacterium]